MKKIISLIAGLGLLACALSLPAAEPAAAPESFQIRNKKFGDLLRPEDASGATGARIVLYPAQSWKCLTWKLHPAGESVFQFQNHFTSKTFASDPKTDGPQAAVTQVPFSKEAKDRPAWRVIKGTGGLCQIVEVKSGKALAAAPDNGGARVVAAPVGDGDEQKWELVKTDPSKLSM